MLRKIVLPKVACCMLLQGQALQCDQLLECMPCICSAASEAAAAAVTALEAAWALTNLAAADHEVAGAVLPAAPALILHLAGGSGVPVAQQAAWALGAVSAGVLSLSEHNVRPLQIARTRSGIIAFGSANSTSAHQLDLCFAQAT